MHDNPRQRDGGTWTAFLVAAFGVLGLVGAFSVFAAQIPFQRALARSATLENVLVLANGPDAAARLQDLRPALDDSADHIMAKDGTPLPDIATKIADERRRMFQALGAESEDIGTRLRIVIAGFTAACALFGAAVLSIVRRAA